MAIARKINLGKKYEKFIEPPNHKPSLEQKGKLRCGASSWSGFSQATLTVDPGAGCTRATDPNAGRSVTLDWEHASS